VGESGRSDDLGVSPVTDIYGSLRSSFDAKRRLIAVAAITALLLSGCFVVALRSRNVSARASATASQGQTDMLAAERVVAAFWMEREVLGEYLVSPLPILAAEARDRQLSFERALQQVNAQSPAEKADIGRARAANAAMIALFPTRRAPTGDVRDLPGERRVHAAELTVLAPIARLTAANSREFVVSEASAASAQRAGFRVAIAASLLGLLAIAWFVVFAFRLVRRIENQKVDLELAHTVKDEFIANVSHEFRTPLTSMHGFVEMLLDESGEPLTKEEQRAMLATVQRGSVRLQGLVNDLLLTAQLRTGSLEIQMASTDAVEIARLSVESAQAHAGNRGIRLSLFAPTNAIQIDADAIRLAQAVDNLISNAIKFTPEGGRVDVTLVQDGDRAILTVADTGMGMTATDIEHLFEPFFRTDSAKQIQGTGLGLPIVEAIVEAHHGTITVTSEPNVGTSFAISLPLADSAHLSLSRLTQSASFQSEF
jgi:signal transduction histidine kinase